MADKLIEYTYRQTVGLPCPLVAQVSYMPKSSDGGRKFHVMITGSYDLNAWNSSLEKMSQLKEGWDGYGAESPSTVAIATARAFLESILGRGEPSRIVPSVVGGVGITHKRRGRRAYVEFYNDGEVIAIFSDSLSEPVTKKVQVTSEAFKQLCEEIKDYLDARSS